MKISGSHSSVLITGPSGSGKEVVAQMLHAIGGRHDGPLVALNCAAVASELLESEMFGHEAGAFTGAVKARAGRFEAADGGTLFLDEVGDMSLAMQAKLLRVLETRRVERVGSLMPIAVDVRVVAATSCDLDAALACGKFRPDLLYRLDVIHIVMPALAERAEDIPHLIEHFRRSLGPGAVRFTIAAMDLLMAQPWPGNVRELKNLVDRAQALHPGETLDRDCVARLLRRKLAAVPAAAEASLRDGARALPRLDGQGVDLRQLLADVEAAYITEALALANGSIAATARLLGLGRTTLIEKLRRLNVEARAA